MVSVFVDTSALFALIDAVSSDHSGATGEFVRLCDERAQLRTHSYVVVETASLVQRRLGMEAAAAFHRDLLPLLSVRFVDEALHRRSTTALLAANRRKVSLVDWTSFEMMREEQLADVFGFDAHFAEQGFALRPAV